MTDKLMSWQPIETAPKDGTTILVYDPDECSNPILVNDTKFGIVRWYKDQWNVGDFVNKKGEVLYNIYVGNPTHWTPLPEIPE